MKDFIYSIINLLKDHKNEISKIQTFKKGVLPPLPAFGAISVMPVSMSFNYQHSGGYFDKAKEVQIQVYLKGMNIKTIKQELRDIINKIIEILVSNYTLDDKVYDLFIDRVTSDDPLELINGIIQRSVIHLIGYNREQVTGKDQYQDLKFGNENSLIEQIYQFLTSNKTFNMEKVRHWYTHAMGPKMAYPLVLINGSLDADRVRSYTGMDTLGFTSNINVFTKLIDKDFSLFTNLDIAEDISYQLMKSSNLGGYTIDHQIYEINYYQTLNPILGLVYQTVVTLTAEVPRKNFNNF